MRVASLLPSATEILYAIGVEPIGVSHSCDFPPGATDRPVLTSTPIASDEGHSAGEIDEQVRDLEGNTYHVDGALLSRLDPDLVITQATCEVCAVDSEAVLDTIDRHGIDADVLTLDPHGLSDVFSSIERIGRATGQSDASEALRSSLRSRLDRIEAIADDEAHPDVAVFDWTDPPIASGHWVMDLIAHAGGRSTLNDGGESRPVRMEQVLEADPDVIVVAPCGFDLDRSIGSIDDLRTHREWETLRAVEAGRVYAVDGNQYFNRPGPRLVDSIELLTACLHPGIVIDRIDGAVAKVAPKESHQ